MNHSLLNPHLIKVARQARSMSQSQLAEKAGLTQAAISKFEAGLITPAEEAIVSLSEALSFPTTFFYQTDPIFGVPVSISYRKKSSQVKSRDIERIEAEMNLRLMHLRRLLSSVEYEPELSLPMLDIEEFDGNAERIAQLVRSHWRVPSGPIHNLTSLIERAGCVVFQCNFQSLGVDGLTLRPPGLPPCIFLNSAMPGDRQRFTLAHELGHTVMHNVPNPDMEDQANTFASELLMPRRERHSIFHSNVDLPLLASIKPIWKVSMGFSIMAAKNAGIISPSQSSYLWRRMSAMGYRKKEPSEVDIAPEKSSVVMDIIELHTESLGYTYQDLYEYLKIKGNDFKSLYGISNEGKPKLKLVKN
ncbi:helix-turn-helix domain-containing protein [Vreelandella titanicae]|uniref:helix-turn-helix domain-containing protein n=1 Tax=Vreelandella titanicae TaxID=664683 RepID=UPI003FD723CC|tara:strand:+ start:7433 stop:8512 length:1080 start_codon:yes stop_codon:yes gene_type:complete